MGKNLFNMLIFYFLVGCYDFDGIDDAVVDLFEDDGGISIGFESKDLFICLDEEFLDDKFCMAGNVETQVRINDLAYATVESMKHLNISFVVCHVFNHMIEKIHKGIATVHQVSQVLHAFCEVEAFYYFGDLLKPIYAFRNQLIQFVIIPIDIH